MKYKLVTELLGSWEQLSCAISCAADDLAAFCEREGVTPDALEEGDYCTCIRVLVWPEDGRWSVQTGDVQYDTEHAPVCVASEVSWSDDGWEHGYEVARRLLDGLEYALGEWQADDDGE